MILREMYGCAILLEENATTTPHLWVFWLQNFAKFCYDFRNEHWCTLLLGASYRHSEGGWSIFISKSCGDRNIDIRGLCQSPKWINQGLHRCGVDEILVSSDKYASEWWGLAACQRHGCSESKANRIHFN